jgi:hypothetical protein
VVASFIHRLKPKVSIHKNMEGTIIMSFLFWKPLCF